MAAGFGVAVLAAVLGPPRPPPLYDGIVPLDPYRYLAPSSGQLNGATGVTKTLAVSSGTNPIARSARPNSRRRPR